MLKSFALIIFYSTQLVAFSQRSNQVEFFISVLANDSLEGRGIQSSGIEIAKKFIIKNLKNNNIKPYKLFDYTSKFNIHSHNIETSNIISKIDNKKDSTILFIAHYDHLDTCSFLSKELVLRKKCLIHNGADDNASGVALLLSLAVELNALDKASHKYNYIFAFTSAHEIGFFGASNLVTEKKIKKEKIKAVFNFDMVGRLNESTKQLIISKNTTKNIFINYKNELINPVFNDLNLVSTDVSVFLEKGFECYTFTTGKHNDYHCSTDDTEKINFQGIYLIKDFIVYVVKNF